MLLSLRLLAINDKLLGALSIVWNPYYEKNDWYVDIEALWSMVIFHIDNTTYTLFPFLHEPLSYIKHFGITKL